MYANPFPSVIKQKSDYYAQWYVYPYFNQNWNLFVPAPNTNYKLLVCYEQEGKQKVEVLREILNAHQTNRFLGYSAVLLNFANSIHYFEKNTALLKPLNGPIKNDLYFQMLEQSALNYIQTTRHISLSHVKLMLCVSQLSSPSNRVYFN